MPRPVVPFLVNEITDMPSSFYIRVKGRVQGPFDLKKLKLMAQLGQLSRIHQVSQDQVSWRKAGEFAELFQAPPSSPKTDGYALPNQPRHSSQHPEQTVDSKDSYDQADAEEVQQPGSKEKPIWYVEVDAQPEGPLCFSELKDMFRIHGIEASRLVWREGMEDWVSATTVNGLVPTRASISDQRAVAFGTPSTSAASPQSPVDDRPLKLQPMDNDTSSRSHDISDLMYNETVNLITKSHTWINFLAIGCLVIAAICAFWAVFPLIEKRSGNSQEVVVNTIIRLLGTGIFAFLGATLITFSKSLSRVQANRAHICLHDALRKLNRFWLVMGIGMLVCSLLSIVYLALKFTAL